MARQLKAGKTGVKDNSRVPKYFREPVPRIVTKNTRKIAPNGPHSHACTTLGVIENAMKVASRIHELRAMSKDRFDDIKNYNVEDQALRQPLIDLQNEQFNGVPMFNKISNSELLHFPSNRRSQLPLDPDQTLKTQRAFNKLLWIQNDFISRQYC